MLGVFVDVARARDLLHEAEALYVLHYIIAGPDDLEDRACMIHELTQAARESANRDTAIIALIDIACDAIMIGDREGALRMREEVDVVAGLTSALGANHWARAVVGCAELARGDEVAAREQFEILSRRDFGDVDRSIRWIGTFVEIAKHCGDLDDAPAARILLGQLATASDQHGMLPMPINYGGPVKRCMARLQAQLGFADEARSLYDEALGQAESLGARPTLAEIELEASAVYARSGETAHARELLADSARLAALLGLSHLEVRASEALSRL